MEKELQEKLVEVITQMQGAVARAADFTLEQLPDVAQSYVMYGRALHTTAVLLSIVAICMLGYMWWKCVKKEHFAEDAQLGAVMLTMVVVGVAATGIVVNAAPALLVWLAPKVWLIKELAVLVR